MDWKAVAEIVISEMKFLCGRTSQRKRPVHHVCGETFCSFVPCWKAVNSGRQRSVIAECFCCECDYRNSARAPGNGNRAGNPCLITSASSHSFLIVTQFRPRSRAPAELHRLPEMRMWVRQESEYLPRSHRCSGTGESG